MVDHNKIITSVARPLLKAHNFKQKGVSRSFIQDNQWYSIFIEFQPYSYRKGTFLNVNACFIFTQKITGHLTMGIEYMTLLNLKMRQHLKKAWKICVK